MRISVIVPAELGHTELSAWSEMQMRTASLRNPFLSASFSTAVATMRPRARVAVLEEAQRIVGFFPFERRKFGVGTAIGMGFSDCQGLVHEPGLEWDPWELLLKSNLSVWEFDHLLTDQRPFTPHHYSRTRSPIIDLRDGYDDYLAGRRAGHRNVVQATWRKRRKLEREVGAIDFVYDSRDPNLLRKVMGWKSAQWRRTAQPDKLANPSVTGLLHDLFATRETTCYGSLSVLFVNGEAIAGHFGIRSSSVLASWFPAYNPDFEGYSPGLLMFFLMAEAAAATGIGHIDLGKGEMRYKDSLANGEIAIAEGAVERSFAIGALRRVRHAPDRQLKPWLRRHPRAHAAVRRIRDELRNTPHLGRTKRVRTEGDRGAAVGQSNH
jgi:CelD/BcsL family acetyltransferase involved in cellulose biosynthesis